MLRIIIGLLLCHGLHAATTPLSQTQSKLKKIDAKIESLKQTLASAQDKKGLLNAELADTEKQIGKGVQTLSTTQKKMSTKEHKIAQLQEKINHLNQQLKTQQHLLAKHVRARYQMGENQMLKWLIDQNEPYRISRLLTYYQYLVQSRQDLIKSIDETSSHLKENKTILKKELAKAKLLKQELDQHQEKLVEHKNYQNALIQSLTNEIENNQRFLKEAQKDKANLAGLLDSLAQQSLSTPNKPFAQLRKKLPRPVLSPIKKLKPMNQGMTFFAEEGTQVSAVYSGKVVFSDWLKGYGLLLIIDHGQGFMTLYAHNQALFKRKGQHVSQNEHIANVGHSGGIKENGLYFEVRVKGKAVSPLEWLA